MIAPRSTVMSRIVCSDQLTATTWPFHWLKRQMGQGGNKRYSVTRRKNRDTEQDNWLDTRSWPTPKLFHVHGKLIKTPTSCPSGLWRTMDLTHSVCLLKKVCTACWIGCFSQNLLIIGRFNHLSFENRFPTSEMLAVKEGKTPCDVALVKSRVRQSIVHCSPLITASSKMIFIDDLLKQDGCLHKPEKERKQRKWQKEAEEKMWQILKRVGNCF